MDLRPGLRREPAPDLEAIGRDEQLAGRIHAEIARQGPITFARFMELALYDPEGGYYRSGTARPGRAGDFLTAPETHPIFGEALAGGIDEIWRRLDRPDPFVLREYGAGEGSLGLAILGGLRKDASDLASVLRYDPIEVEPRRLATIAARLAEAGHEGALVEQGASDQSIVGVVLANEVLDALPTHRVAMHGGRFSEILVGSVGTRFADVEAEPTTPELAERLAVESVELAEGQRAEVCLALDGWMASAAAGLARGVMVLVDYGYPAAELYDPRRRHGGTLLAYLRQRALDDPYAHVGLQDLTAHVDVTAVERAAARAGLAHLGTTTQAEFLMGLGVEGRLRAIQAAPDTTIEAYLAVRSGLMRLLDPAATGRFRVIGFAREWPDGPPLSGLAYRLGNR